MSAKSQPISTMPPRSRPQAGSDLLETPITHQIGGHLALDFCNTAGDHMAVHPTEMLRDWESFLRWATQVGLAGRASYLELLPHPEPVEPIVELREAMYRIGRAIVDDRPLPDRDLLEIRNQANAPRPAISFRARGLYWRPDRSQASAQLCSVLAHEALSLFCSPKTLSIGICESGMCGWLFLDESRGMRRRWCDMNDCGSRAKAKRHYQKLKARKSL